MKIGTLMVATALLMFGVQSAPAEIIDRILAIVAGQLITKSDVEASRALGLIDVRPAEGQSADEAALKAVIDRVLMLSEVRRVVPRAPTDAAIDARLAEIRRRFSTPGALQQALAANGIDESVLRIYAEDDLNLAAYLDERFSAAAQPTDQEILQAGEANRQKLAEERRRALISAWIDELRRRADINVLP